MNEHQKEQFIKSNLEFFGLNEWDVKSVTWKKSREFYYDVTLPEEYAMSLCHLDTIYAEIELLDGSKILTGEVESENT